MGWAQVVTKKYHPKEWMWTITVHVNLSICAQNPGIENEKKKKKKKIVAWGVEETERS